LYIHARRVVLTRRLPVYVVQLIGYFAAVLLHENQADNLAVKEKETLGILEEVMLAEEME